MEEADLQCPKCGRPQEPEALECPYCGIIYSRYRSGSEPSPGAAASPPPATVPTVPLAGEPVAPSESPTGLDDVYQGPPLEELYTNRPERRHSLPAGAARRESRSPSALAGPVVERKTVFSRHLGVSILGALLVLLVVQDLLQSHILGGTDSLSEVRGHFTRLTGTAPPEALDDGGSLVVAGRRFIFLGDSSQTEGQFPAFVVLYHQGGLAGSADAEELQAAVPRKLNQLGFPWYGIAGRSVEVAGRSVPAQILGIGTRERSVGRVIAVSLTATDGRPALLAVGGSSREAMQLLRDLGS